MTKKLPGIVLLLAFLASLLVPAAASAAGEVKPLGIKNFTIQTVERTEETLISDINNEEEYEFVNKPYVFTQAGGHPWALTTTGEFDTEELEAIENRPELFGEPSKNYFAPTRDP
ncbi:MAG TPA: hypothetical protein VK756_11265, partial [Solirubrobacteraceae bacterium]|nr:hypothetical protein [Solirubrobacteraceae bacterium]